MSYNPYPSSGPPPQASGQGYPYPPVSNNYPPASGSGTGTRYDQPPPSHQHPPPQSHYPDPAQGHGYDPAPGYGSSSAVYNERPPQARGYEAPYPPQQRGGGRDSNGPVSGRGSNYGGGGREMSPDGRRGYNPPPRHSAEPSQQGYNDSRASRDRDREPRKDPRSNEERISLERQCRTLFVRNISFDADPEKLKIDFSSHGEIKSWFDMIGRRGMAFITYYDLRPAQRAKDALHGIQIGSRKIDVHYGLPKESELEARCDREKNQGSILIILKPRIPIDMAEAGRMCDSFGEVKSLKGCKSPDQAIVEFWDSRGAISLFDRMDKQPFCGGILDLKFIWDAPPPSHVATAIAAGSGQGRRTSGGGNGYSDRDSYSSGPPQNRYPDTAAPPSRYSDAPGPPNRYSDNGPPPNRYSDAPPQNRYADAPPGTTQGDDRLDQAKKVQQLLASLGNVAPAPPPASAPAPAPAPPYRSVPPPFPPPPPAHGGPGGYNTSVRPPPPPPPQGGYRPSADPRGPPAPSLPPPPASGYNAPPPQRGYGGPPSGGYAPPSPGQAQGQGGYNPNPNPAPYAPYPNTGSEYGPPSGGVAPSAYGHISDHAPVRPPPPPQRQGPPQPPMGSDPRRQGQGQGPVQGQGQGQGYRPPPPPSGQPQQQAPSDVGSLLAMLNQRR